jgi:hypothetical protein
VLLVPVSSAIGDREYALPLSKKLCTDSSSSSSELEPDDDASTLAEAADAGALAALLAANAACLVAMVAALAAASAAVAASAALACASAALACASAAASARRSCLGRLSGPLDSKERFIFISPNGSHLYLDENIRIRFKLRALLMRTLRAYFIV